MYSTTFFQGRIVLLIISRGPQCSEVNDDPKVLTSEKYDIIRQHIGANDLLVRANVGVVEDRGQNVWRIKDKENLHSNTMK